MPTERTTRLRLLGASISTCRDASCPGLVQQRVTNAPDRGVYPRGLFMHPRSADVDDITAVVLSQNPGGADIFERWAHRLLARVPDANHFDELSGVLGDGAGEIRHYERILELLGALWADASQRSFLFAEVVYCENGADRGPNDQTFVHCAQRHLERQLDEVVDDTVVLCLGDRAAAWFASYPARDRFRWVQAEHPSGKNRHWKKLFHAGDLTPAARTAWAAFLGAQRPTTNGARLSGEAVPRPMKRR